MALPRMNETLGLTMTIPSTSKKVKFRPYLVKEEKILLQAFESQDLNLILNTMCDTIESCLDESSNVSVADLATFDVEYMFTQIRSASVGENSTIVLKCEKCETDNNVSVDLSELKVDVSDVDKVIELTDQVSVEMKYPSYRGITSEGNIVSEDTDPEQIISVLATSIDAVLTEDERIEISSQSPEEVKEFLNSLTTAQFQKLGTFLEEMPQLEHTAEFECSNCKTQNKLELKGLADFF
jgi:nucleoid DNA-binding protein